MKKNLKRLALLWLFPALFLPGIFVVLAGLLWGAINVSAGTAFKVGTILAANQFFVNPEQKINTYLVRQGTAYVRSRITAVNVMPI
ncbi:MAG: hypothetical protein A2021_04885 [Elusimicrobia bacterium GWF2_52_66]|nr:MAG: hypothetical protein A2021_04885 [Elusimicrobia bacterium GWF2_52_66]